MRRQVNGVGGGMYIFHPVSFQRGTVARVSWLSWLRTAKLRTSRLPHNQVVEPPV